LISIRFIVVWIPNKSLPSGKAGQVSAPIHGRPKSPDCFYFEFVAGSVLIVWLPRESSNAFWQKEFGDAIIRFGKAAPTG